MGNGPPPIAAAGAGEGGCEPVAATRHCLQAGRWRLAVACGADLAVQAQSLLAMVARLGGGDGHALRDGLVIEFGWAPLQLVAHDGELDICEPDFDADAAHFRPQADTVLRVLAKQAALTQACAARALAARFDHAIRVAPGALNAAQIELRRDQPATALDSGWRLCRRGDAPSGAPGGWTAWPVYRLLHERPAVMKALALPPGWRAAFDGDDLTEVLDAQGRAVWPCRPAPAA